MTTANDVNRPEENTPYDVAVIGAGPTGLACGLRAVREGLRHIIFDKGTIVNTIVGYPTYTMFFSTPERLSLEDLSFTTPNFRPTRAEAIAYYRGVAESADLNLRLHTAVDRVEREGEFFRVNTSGGDVLARAVVLATGYFDNTNRLGVPGEELPHVSHYYKEPYPYYDTDVLVIGGRNSAVEAALDLYRNGARVTMIHRREGFSKSVKYWIRPDIENRIASGEITMLWETEVARIEQGRATVRNNRTGEESVVRADAVFALIGYRPDEQMLQRCGIAYDPETLVPQFDPETFETNVPGLFLAGSVACGCKTWEIFIENGREHARTVVTGIARRLRQGGTVPD